jgi:tryptophan-rich sensory protein
MLEFPGAQGAGIDGESSLAIRLAALATVPIMLIISGIAGAKTGKVSNKFDLIVTPPGAFFAIWGIIYLGLIVSGVYCVISNTWSLGVTVLFAVVNLLNALWVYVFSFSTIKTNNICAIIVVLMAVLN